MGDLWVLIWGIGDQLAAQRDIFKLKVVKNGYFPKNSQKMAIFSNFELEYVPLRGALVPDTPYKYP